MTRCRGCLLDRRAARVTAIHDETWLRVIDVQQALTARRYPGDGAITIAVNDPLLQSNSASFVIAATVPIGRTGVLNFTSVSKASAAVLLGGATWRSLAVGRAGRCRRPVGACHRRPAVRGARRAVRRVLLLIARVKFTRSSSSARGYAGLRPPTSSRCADLPKPFRRSRDGVTVCNHGARCDPGDNHVRRDDCGGGDGFR